MKFEATSIAATKLKQVVCTVIAGMPEFPKPNCRWINTPVSGIACSPVPEALMIRSSWFGFNFASSNASRPASADMKFETALAELENIVSSMEGGKLELDASIAAYRRGMELMKHCQTQLADADEQIRMLENGEFKEVDRSTLEAQ